MKVITEAILRDELRATTPEYYKVPEGRILSPAAREYLQQCKIKIDDGKGKVVKRVYDPEVEEAIKADKAAAGSPSAPDPEDARPDVVATALPGMPEVQVKEGDKPKFVDYENGSYYYSKPEHMTHLFGNTLVTKDHKRILFRGKLDSLEALFVLNQTILAEMGEPEALLADLQDVVLSLREMMRCDVLDEAYTRDHIIGLTHAELREHSHNPMKFHKIKQMILPDYTLGKAYALLNQLRTAVRETEVAAATAFRQGNTFTRGDIIQELNRTSSAMHIIMCKYLAKEYE